MHLRRLDLVGFKSFANRTTFVFEPGITVLCGPNGSGKSNIADGVRWALGEQNARAVRGRRGEDVIFVGSQGRQPLGLAEVSLTLDNSDGRIPLDYQEVKITRRLYRSGDAEYLVNGAKVRLKDIHQWLLHAAIDAEAYVVVGQGSVDELILQRPEERRVVIDNAADIRRHQTRLHETRSRLSSTEENLLRCRAVIAELEPHVQRLRVQAERAERGQVLRAELSALAGRWLRHALAGARQELARTQRDAQAARQQSQRQDAELADLERLARDAEADASRAEARVSELEPRLAAARDEVARISRELARAEERLAGADEAEARLLTDLERQREREAALSGERDLLLKQREAARMALRAADQAVAAAAESDRAAEEEGRAVDAAVAAARRRLSAAENDVRGARAAYDDARGRLERLERRQARLGEDIERLTHDLERARTTAAERAASAEQTAATLADSRRRRDALAARRDENRQHVDRLRAEQHRLAGERQRLEIARQAAADAGAVQRGAGRDLLVKERVPGVRGVLAGELIVPERLRAAIGAALGERAQSVVVDDAESARASAAALRRRDADRTGVAPVHATPHESDGGSAVFQAAAGAALAGQAIVGFGDHLVEATPELAGLAQRVLGLTVVVETVDDAEAVAVRLHRSAAVPPGWQVATLDGVVVRASGEWWAGRDRLAERLVRRRSELARIEQELAGVQSQLQSAEQQLAAAQSEVAALAAEERANRDAVTAAEAADRKATLEAQSAAAQASRLDRELRDARGAGPAIEADLQRTRAQVQRAGEAADAAEQRRLEAADALTQAERQHANLAARLAEGRAARASRQADLARCRAEAQGADALVMRQSSDLENALRSVADAVRRVEGERNRRAEIASAAQQHRAALAQAEQAVAPLRDALDAARESRQQARAKRGAIEQTATEIRARARAGRTVLEAAVIAESRAADRLERVRREAQEYVDDIAGADGSVQLRLDLDGGGADACDQGDAVEDPTFDPDAARRRMATLRRELRAIGDVGEATLAEFRELSERHGFLVTQVADLEAAGEELRRVMEELTGLMRGAFDTAFAAVNAAFGEYFARLFAGGHAELVLNRPDDVLDSGVDIVARPPGKRLQSLVSLSGGERALTMVALIFALLKTNPAPFCVLDEVDAALDESNVRRFTSVLAELSDRTQFMVVSHNRATMEAAQALYGISMDTVGVSTVVSLKLPATAAAVAANGANST